MSDNISSLSLRQDLKKTYIENVFVTSVDRFIKGQTVKVPSFLVKRNGEDIFISINSHGWRKSWKKALLSLTGESGRGRVVRFLNKPPKLSEYFAD